MKMDCVYASPDMMEERRGKRNTQGGRTYPLSRADDEREQWLLTNTIYNAPEFTAAMNWRLEEEEPVMECVYASPDMMEWTEPLSGTTEWAEPAPKKKRGLFSRLFGGKK